MFCFFKKKFVRKKKFFNAYAIADDVTEKNCKKKMKFLQCLSNS